MKSSPVLRSTTVGSADADDCFSSWPFVQRILSTIDAVASSRASVMITGESGTGKELVARSIHMRGVRRGGPFRAINCAALPEPLFESELFGLEAGSFTGANRQKPGLFELANGGTLLLDEVTEMSPALQAKMLRVLQEREVQRIGSLVSLPIDVRIIATTNRHLHDEIEIGNFRKDLYYRLNVVPINVPPLRERRGDIRVLANSFMRKYALEHRKQISGISPAAMLLLERYAWPGNIRELQNFITRAVMIADGPILGPDDFPSELIESPSANVSNAITPGRTIHDVVRDLVTATMAAEKNHQTHAAERLGISTRTLRNKLYEYGLLVAGESSVPSLVERVHASLPERISSTEGDQKALSL